MVDRETGEVEAETDDCPGSHGEAAVQPTDGGDVVVMRCANGPVVYRDGEFHKVDVEPAWQRSGNLFRLHDSPIVLGDDKVEEEPEEAVERTTSIALIDSRTDELETVELGPSYWFRSLGRAEDGSAVVLTYDGELNVIDEETGEKVLEKDLDFAPVEIAVVTGEPESLKPEEAAALEGGHGEHGHEGHAHGAEAGHAGHDH